MRCIDLFAGCGGMSAGFEKAGFNVVAAFDNWVPAINVYKENFKHPIIEQDLRYEKESVNKIRDYCPDLIIGGPPCQDFSSAGKRDVTRGHANMTHHFANIVSDIKPLWFVMENVEQIKRNKILQDVIEKFLQVGYGLTAKILDASLCGVPQARSRYFLIGKLGGDHNMLDEAINENLSIKHMTIRDYLGDTLGIEYYYRHPRNYNRRGVFSIDEPSPTIRGVNRPIPKGYNLNSCDPTNVSLKDIRQLTTIERSLIQTFPRDFKFSGSKTNLDQMIGNAVPVNLAYFVANVIKQTEKNYISPHIVKQILHLPNKKMTYKYNSEQYLLL